MNLIESGEAAFNQKPSYRATPGDWVRAGGHARSLAAHRFLNQLVCYRNYLRQLHLGEELPITWLLGFRNDFRRLILDENLAVIHSFMLVGDDQLRPIAIWLTSQLANRTRLFDIEEYCDDPSPVVRKHVAKALRKLEAWPLLGKMLTADPDDAKLHWFASAPIRQRPFSESLEKYSQTVDQSHADEVVTPSRMPFWRRESFWERTPPKSVLAIRRVLRRIRHLVRWGVG
jgi:hypothetical protein